MNYGQDTPRNRVRVQQMRKQFRHIAQFVRFEAVYGIVLLRKCLHERVAPAIVLQQTKPGGNETVVPQKGAFLRAAFNQHINEFFFATFGNVNASQFVCALFKGGTGHDSQVNGAAQVHEIRIGKILNYLCWFTGNCSQ